MAPLLAALFLLLPIRASRRPIRLLLWALLVAAGTISGLASTRDVGCPSSGSEPITGRFLADPRGGSAPFRIEGVGCDVRVVAPPDVPSPGRPSRLSGTWREGQAGAWFLAASAIELEEERPDWRWAHVRWRGALAERLHRMYGPRGPLVAALILARREGLDRDLREAFARSGIAHLLAISGFHVGVVSGLILTLLRAAAVSRRRAAIASAVATWLYVGLIGFPDAACRAALIIALVTLSRARGRPAARWGALGSAFLILLVLEPTRLWSPGFQLSFAGAAGLVAWARPLRRGLVEVTGRRCPHGLARALSAGIAATAATVPIVAWHFERISIVGIPGTLLASPLVAVAVPGALASLLLDFVGPPGAFVAGGVDSLLWALEWGTRRVGGIAWASAWTSQGAVRIASVGIALGALTIRSSGLRAGVRRITLAGWAASALIAWPALLSLTDRGTIQLHVLDVGQGDAIAIRTPHARWILVDAGPPADREGAPHPVVRELRARGALHISMLLLTHPDLDHIGGAAAVLASLDVERIMDPARPSPSRAYLELLERSHDLHVPWGRVEAGDRWEIDGVTLHVLAPFAEPTGGDTESNAASLVIHLRYGAFDALLTGDAPREVERIVARSLSSGLEVLKVAHHGSATSTDSLLLARARPEVALISVGRRNRYGHPSDVVLRRLVAAGVRVHRTDREGTLEVVARADGSFSVATERPGATLAPGRDRR